LAESIFSFQHPQTEINPEQTAPLISFFTFTFLDPVIAASRRVAHLSYAMLPPQVDHDAMRALRPRTYRFLDPFATRRRKINVFLALLRAFAPSWGAQTILLCLAVRLVFHDVRILADSGIRRLPHSALPSAPTDSFGDFHSHFMWHRVLRMSIQVY
jgi:hypothetical protein